MSITDCPSPHSWRRPLPKRIIVHFLIWLIGGTCHGCGRLTRVRLRRYGKLTMNLCHRCHRDSHLGTAPFMLPEEKSQ